MEEGRHAYRFSRYTLNIMHVCEHSGVCTALHPPFHTQTHAQEHALMCVPATSIAATAFAPHPVGPLSPCLAGPCPWDVERPAARAAGGVCESMVSEAPAWCVSGAGIRVPMALCLNQGRKAFSLENGGCTKNLEMPFLAQTIFLNFQFDATLKLSHRRQGWKLIEPSIRLGACSMNVIFLASIKRIA